MDDIVLNSPQREAELQERVLTQDELTLMEKSTWEDLLATVPNKVTNWMHACLIEALGTYQRFLEHGQDIHQCAIATLIRKAGYLSLIHI